MGKKKASTNKFTGMAAVVTMVTSVAPLVQPAIKVVREYTDKIVEDRKKLITVPEIYSKEYPLSVEQAEEILESCGLKATLVKMNLSDADIRYRRCFDTQVVRTNPRAKQKVEQGTCILLKYITQEVIDESQRIYELAEKHKEESSLKRREKQTARKEKTKRMTSETIAIASNSLKKVPSVFNNITQRKKNNEEK